MKDLTLDEWRDVAEYWANNNKDMKHIVINMPSRVAKALGFLRQDAPDDPPPAELPITVAEQLEYEETIEERPGEGNNTPRSALNMSEFNTPPASNRLLLFDDFKQLVNKTYGKGVAPEDIQIALQHVEAASDQESSFTQPDGTVLRDEKTWYEALDIARKNLENKMPTQTEPENITADSANEPKWKRKRHFDGETCGYVGCERPADGYVPGKKPTKGGAQGALWYGPACTECIRKWHSTLNPLNLNALRQHRATVSDMANVLDIEVGDLLARFTAAGLDEDGRHTVDHIASGHVNHQQAQAPQIQQEQPVQQETSGQLAVVNAGPIINTDPIMIPAQHLADKLAYARGLLASVAPFHISSQADMDYVGGFLTTVKGMWKELEERRLSITKPLRDKIEEAQDHFKPPLALLKEAEVLLKKKLDEGWQRSQAAIQSAYAAGQQALQAGDLGGAAVATQQATASHIAIPQGTQFQTVTKWEIVDYNLLPQNFWQWVPNAEAVKAAVDAGYTEIPGVRVWQENIVKSMSAR